MRVFGPSGAPPDEWEHRGVILRIARLVPKRGDEQHVIAHLRAILARVNEVPGLVHGSVARELLDDRQVLWVVSAWESAAALEAFVGPDLADLRLPDDILARLDEYNLTHAEGIDPV
jgi:quinol monooxygenase YgiN